MAPPRRSPASYVNKVFWHFSLRLLVLPHFGFALHLLRDHPCLWISLLYTSLWLDFRNGRIRLDAKPENGGVDQDGVK